MVVTVSKLFLMFITTLVLVGCGNKGSLYLPDQTLPTETVTSSNEY
ncbi:LPS translocon maturation chaperone LptM [Marinomonas ostreistagni]|uniref:Lipoprotein n=1 Tax=Marinomonas ostreistagni TaxID=359209 RepID=A0ABS0Z7C7_9GAMM|nr:lipoprotein [Marinomonas ostreistagni]MBJ7549333.1 lipoprotein [Marinomonas ostreistagni]